MCASKQENTDKRDGSQTQSIVDQLYGIASNLNMTLDEIREERISEKLKYSE